MTVMKVIVELTARDDVADLTTTQLQMLVTDGVADFEVFEACWKKYMPAELSPGINVRHLCMIFQAYCLLYPVQSITMQSTAESDEQAVQKFIIPCKLPDEIDDRNVHKRSKKYSTFYIDFCKFLLEEIYHRLICLATSNCEVKQNQRVHNCYSKRSCFFWGLRDSNWVIELEPENQRLKIMFM